MKKFLIVLALFGVAEFALAEKTANNVFGTEFEFDIDEYANKPCGEDWSEFEKKMCNMDRNSFTQMTHDDTKNWYEAFQPCVENSDEKVCERHKISWSKHRKIAAQIVAECEQGNADSCYDVGRDMITEIHNHRDNRAAKIAFEVGCSIYNSAKNCEQLGFMLSDADEENAKAIFAKACDLDKNYCVGKIMLDDNISVLKTECENDNMFGCLSYLTYTKETITLHEANQIIDKVCKFDIDKEFERSRASFDTNDEFESYKNYFKNTCKKREKK